MSSAAPPCQCEDLKARLETVDWSGDGVGLRFERLVVEEIGPLEPYEDYVLGGESVSPDLSGEAVIRRLGKAHVVSRIPPLDSTWVGVTYQIDQTVLRVNDQIGQITLRTINDVDAATRTFDKLAAELGEAERPGKPKPSINERIISALGPLRGAIVSLSLVFLSLMWLRLRTIGVIRYPTTPVDSSNRTPFQN